MLYLDREDAAAEPPRSRSRPRARTLVRLDPENAYARLGVSPMLATDEIKKEASRQRGELMQQRRNRAVSGFDQTEQLIADIQAIEDSIGTPKKRAKYDEDHPQNELLTIQPSPDDRWLEPRHRSSLITRWLVEELGRDAALPSPEYLGFWCPRGIGPALSAFLQAFVQDAPNPASEAGAVEAAAQMPRVADLSTLAAGTEPGPRPNPESTSHTDPISQDPQAEQSHE